MDHRTYLPVALAVGMLVPACTGDGPTNEADIDAMPQTGGAGGVAAGMGGGTDGGPGCSFVGTQAHPHTSEPAMHVGQPLAPADYNSSPPSSGPHCGSWGQYTTYAPSAPLPACNFVHNLEHGAIALLYNCPQGCADLVAALQAVLDDPPMDPNCAAPRLLLTPYADMQTKVAAAAWGYTWTANCLDAAAVASLRTFIATYIGTRGDAPESRVCQGGSVRP